MKESLNVDVAYSRTADRRRPLKAVRWLRIGFHVSAEGRTTNAQTGAVSTGDLAPFVQLRLILIDTATQRALKSSSVGEGFIVGSPTPEAPDPWRYLNREEKARALKDLLQRTITRGLGQLFES